MYSFVHVGAYLHSSFSWLLKSHNIVYFLLCTSKHLYRHLFIFILVPSSLFKLSLVCTPVSKLKTFFKFLHGPALTLSSLVIFLCTRLSLNLCIVLYHNVCANSFPNCPVPPHIPVLSDRRHAWLLIQSRLTALLTS